MSKPIIVCIADAHRELEALLRPQPNDAYALECFESIDEARVWIEQALKSGTEFVGALIEDFRDAELPVMVHRLPEARDRAPETLRAMLGDILTRFELDGLRARNQLLESLSDVGVALAGSFDIQAILRKTREAAEQLAKGRTVEVLYKGCDRIHSRALWHPEQPSPGSMARDERRRMLARVSRDHDDVPTAFEHGGRLFLPIAYQRELLGLLVLSTGPPRVNSSSSSTM